MSSRTRREDGAEVSDFLVDVGLILNRSRHFLAQEQPIAPSHLVNKAFHHRW
jgi:hypothetical protein